MTTRMLIDARHPEETRVAVLKGNRIDEFDFESADHKQIKGNIYLAKVTRVEPSLQAAFVDFGGNRQYISLGNLAENPKAFIFLMDYVDQRRIKLWGRARVIEDDAALIEIEADAMVLSWLTRNL